MPLDKSNLPKDWIRRSTAYHEAGHVAVAYYFGWWLGPDGVEIDAQWYAGLQCRSFTNPLHIAAVNCAGWLSECRRLGRDGTRDEADLLYHIDNVRGGWGEEEDSDDLDTFDRLMAVRPDTPSEELIATFRECEQMVRKILDDPVVWRSVEALAAALIAEGELDRDQAEAVLVDAGLIEHV